MNYKKLTISTIAIFAFIFLLDWLVNSYFLSNYYAATPSLWRSDMEEYITWNIVLNIIISFIYYSIFVKYRPNNSVQMGLIIGTLIGVVEFTSYTCMPISMFLASMWLLLDVIKGLGAGIIFSIIDSK